MEALTPSFTVHCPPATAEELSSLCRVITFSFVIDRARIDDHLAQVDSG
jgi:hypothetical protein